MNKLSLNEIKKYLNVAEDAQFAKISTTPVQARSLLKRCNRVNRPINHSHIEMLKRDMESGKWYDDIDNIGFNNDGALINGQHRLRALSEANVDSIILNFSFGIEQHISMDTGRNRTHNDQIRIFEKMGENENIIPHEFKKVITAGIKLNDPKIKLTNSELLDLWTKYNKQFMLCENKELFNLGTKANAIVVKSSLFWAYLSGVDINILAQIAKVLRTGINETQYDIPVIRLRDMLIDLTGNSRDIDIKRAKYTQQCIFNVLKGSTSSRLPTYIALHYQDFKI